MKRLEREPLLAIASAKGPWLYGEDGRPYLDAMSSWWVNLFGHGHPRLRAAVAEQFERLDHVMLAGLTHAPVVELSERLTALTGLGHAFYASDGASATEIALKMSAHAWRNAGRAEKCEFVGLEGGYHGETVGALSVTDIALFREAYAPLVRLSATVPAPDARRCAPGETASAFARRCAAALEAHFERHHARTAAFIVEPLVQCAAGFAMHDPEYLRLARALCERYDVHLVCDEIAVGFGRTGTLFAHQQAGIRPDFLCLSKGLTGGTMALSVVLCTETVYEAFYDDRGARGFLHSHSYSGNPLACRAALTVLDLFRDGALGKAPAAPAAEAAPRMERGGSTAALAAAWAAPVLEQNRRTAARLTALCEPLAAHPRVRSARQLGMLWAFDIDTTGLAGFSGAYHLAAREQGLLLRPIGDTLYFMPPYVLDDAALQQLAGGALRALERVCAP